MAKIITVAIKKGGAGKTTTAINLAVGLSKKNKVLIIDTDPQGQIALGLGFNPDNFEHNLTSLYRDVTEEISSCIYSHDSGVHFIPSNEQFAEVITGMNASDLGGLNFFVNMVSNFYDYIVIDTPPTESIITLAALYTSDYVIIPCSVDTFTYDSLKRTVPTIHKMQKINTKLKIAGILLTKVQEKTVTNKVITEEIHEQFKNLVFPFYTKMSVKYIEHSSSGTPIVLAEENNPYNQLVKSIEALNVKTNKSRKVKGSTNRK